MNPCPCGYLGDTKHACKCNPLQVEKYVGQISGPLLDRIDLHIEVPSVPYEDLSKPGDGTGSAAMREQVDGRGRCRRSGSAAGRGGSTAG